jgi:S-adenosylmethionine synthetase
VKNLLINYVSTSESVNEDLYDKVCDRISNAMLDFFLVENQNSKVACEMAVTTDFFRKMEAA